MGHDRGEWKLGEKEGHLFDFGGNEPELVQGYRQSVLALKYENDARTARAGTDHHSFVGN